nr:hypothetical protein [Tanacetum cinerariifolium]
ELSLTSYPGPRVIPSLFRGGKVKVVIVSGVVVEKESEAVVKTKGAGGEDIASSLTISESDQAGI